MADPVTRLLESMERQDAAGLRAAYAPDARLLASVPENFYDLRGAEAIAEKLEQWYASWEEDPSHVFLVVSRTGDRTLVELERTCSYEGARWVARQVHVLEVGEEGIREHRLYCSGPRAGEPLLAQSRKVTT
jgi:ketosteroid isomerase-like protein